MLLSSGGRQEERSRKGTVLKSCVWIGVGKEVGINPREGGEEPRVCGESERENRKADGGKAEVEAAKVGRTLRLPGVGDWNGVKSFRVFDSGPCGWFGLGDGGVESGREGVSLSSDFGKKDLSVGDDRRRAVCVSERRSLRGLSVLDR
ncbi:hypothetical protein AXG93_939s1300 [Marchantia polymorpha subsp. ruderalis]|uniref:Uncharacterized protein n=1 Tax=Marchantia polymorpha subsp. ruderalis TaxID=1480154 RepID=A0A176VMR4_MARPO|nr:hypothetical protein AXG93_939s1300 [Marchantia polymorpha subsp. ruderalis]